MNLLSNLYSIGQYIELVLLIVFYFTIASQVFYYFFFYARIFFFKPQKISDQSFDKPISIIVAAHNEADNLQQFLPSILEQDYPEFELIIINDRSEDETETVIATFQKKYPHLKSTFIKNNGKLKHGKKLAITLGVKASQYEHILLTDADCRPSSNQWIKHISSQLDSKDIVLAYGAYNTENTFLNRIIRFDTLFIALQYMCFSKAGFPYMGIGRNLAYKKELFVKNRGIASHAHMASGDDDLFINEVATSNNVAISYHQDSFTYSIPEKTFKFWVRQKQRHLTTFSRYKKKHQLLLSGEVFSRVLFYILFLGLMSSNFHNMYFWAFASLRMLVSFSILWKSTQIFNERKLTFFLSFFDFILPITNFFIYLETKKTKFTK